MNVLAEIWFWLFLVGVIVFVISLIFYMKYPQQDAPMWVYLWIFLGMFMIFIGIIILISILLYRFNIITFDTPKTLPAPVIDMPNVESTSFDELRPPNIIDLNQSSAL